MPDPARLLCALLPPGSIEAEVGRVQEWLFREHGLVSAVAVPPLIPVAFLEERDPPGGLLRDLNRAANAGWRMQIRGTEWVEGHLFARCESGGTWQTLRAAAGTARAAGAVAAEGAAPFPVSEGFYLGCAETSEENRPGIRPGIPAVSFSSATLAILRIEFASGPEWWQELHWEVLDERPFRGRRDS